MLLTVIRDPATIPRASPNPMKDESLVHKGPDGQPSTMLQTANTTVCFHFLKIIYFNSTHLKLKCLFVVLHFTFLLINCQLLMSLTLHQQ